MMIAKHLDMDKLLDGSAKVSAVINSTLVNNFSGFRSLLEKKYHPFLDPQTIAYCGTHLVILSCSGSRMIPICSPKKTGRGWTEIPRERMPVVFFPIFPIDLPSS